MVIHWGNEGREGSGSVFCAGSGGSGKVSDEETRTLLPFGLVAHSWPSNSIRSKTLIVTLTSGRAERVRHSAIHHSIVWSRMLLLFYVSTELLLFYVSTEAVLAMHFW